MSKGGGAEREVAKKISLWFSEGEHDDWFWRSHSSGARFTQRQKSGKDTENQGGDLTSTCAEGELLIKHWSIEIKSGYGNKRAVKDENKNTVKKIQDRWDSLDFLDSRQTEPVLAKLWKQCKRDALLTNRTPVLIFRRNGREFCICFSKRYSDLLQMHFGDVFYPKITLEIESGDLVIYSLKHFFEWIPDIRSIFHD